MRECVGARDIKSFGAVCGSVLQRVAACCSATCCSHAFAYKWIRLGVSVTRLVQEIGFT